MKPTKDSFFVDSNILIYAHTDLDATKQQIAQKIIIDFNPHISTQVLQETANILHKKFKHSWADIMKVLTDVNDNNQLHTNTQLTIHKACNIAMQNKFSFYDSLIIAAALESNCTILYSEDMHHNQVIDNILKIVNPFV